MRARMPPLPPEPPPTLPATLTCPPTSAGVEVGALPPEPPTVLKPMPGMAPAPPAPSPPIARSFHYELLPQLRRNLCGVEVHAGRHGHVAGDDGERVVGRAHPRGIGDV